jgi:heme/copper-type cytochrome/quinol oxidase subunit 3
MGASASESAGSLLGKLGLAAAEPRDGAGNGAGKVGMWIFLATDAMGFGGMWAAYGVLRARAVAWPDPAERLAIPLAAAMTLALLTSSLTVLLALAAARVGRASAARGWLALSVLCGVAFLAGQGIEYQRLLTETPRMGLASDLYASTFYAITGFHGLHVLAGLLILGVLAARGGLAVRGPRAPLRPSTLEVAALFWHFVDLAWVPIFTFLYLVPAR